MQWINGFKLIKFKKNQKQSQYLQEIEDKKIFK